jgi:hypothetical protein
MDNDTDDLRWDRDEACDDLRPRRARAKLRLSTAFRADLRYELDGDYEERYRKKAEKLGAAAADVWCEDQLSDDFPKIAIEGLGIPALWHCFWACYFGVAAANGVYVLSFGTLLFFARHHSALDPQAVRIAWILAWVWIVGIFAANGVFIGACAPRHFLRSVMLMTTVWTVIFARQPASVHDPIMHVVFAIIPVALYIGALIGRRIGPLVRLGTRLQPIKL